MGKRYRYNNYNNYNDYNDYKEQIDMSITELELDEKISLDDFNEIHDELYIEPFFVNKKFDVVDKILHDKNRYKSGALTLTLGYFINLISLSKSDEIRNILEQDKYDLNYVKMRDKEGDTLLHFSVFANNYHITEIFLKYGVNPNICDKDGQTPLFRTIFCKDSDIVDLLFSYHVDINKQDNAGNTTLHIAVLTKNHAVIKTLLKYNADIEIKNKENFKPIDYAFIKKNGKLMVDELIVAILTRQKR